MVDVAASEKDAFFEEVGKASAAAVWSAWATQSKNGPRVRMVHPTWEGAVLWLATGPGTPKANGKQPYGGCPVAGFTAKLHSYYVSRQG